MYVVCIAKPYLFVKIQFLVLLRRASIQHIFDISNTHYITHMEKEISRALLVLVNGLSKITTFCFISYKMQKFNMFILIFSLIIRNFICCVVYINLN